MNANPLEKDIERRVCDYAKQLGCLTYKFTSPARRSVPDRLIVPNGQPMFFIEFKRKGQKLTEAQAIEHRKIYAQGKTVYTVDDVEEGKQIVKAWCEGRIPVTPMHRGDRFTHMAILQSRKPEVHSTNVNDY